MEEMRLDGNAAGGQLRELFALDVTAAMATCAACGDRRRVGALLEYGQEMGVILRCRGCNAAMMRIVRTPTSLHVDGSVMAMLVIRTDVA